MLNTDEFIAAVSGTGFVSEAQSRQLESDWSAWLRTEYAEGLHSDAADIVWREALRGAVSYPDIEVRYKQLASFYAQVAAAQAAAERRYW